MFSKTKRSVELEIIKKLVFDAFGENTSIGKIEELTDGWFNAAYSVELLSRKSDVVLKISPPPEIKILTYEKNIMQTEVNVMKMLGDETEIPIPKILNENFKRDIINRDFYFMDKLQGTPWDKIKEKIPKEQNDSLKYMWGKYHAKMNSFTGSHFGYFTDSEKKYNLSWKSTFLNMVKNVIKDGESLKTSYPVSSEEIVNVIYAKSSVLDEVTKPQLVHWDLWGGNTFIIKSGEESYNIEGLTDFERALWGDPLLEYIFMSIENEPEFIKGYEEISGKKFVYTNEMRLRRHFYNIYLYLIMYTEKDSRCYTGSKADGIIKWAEHMLKNEIKKVKEFEI